MVNIIYLLVIISYHSRLHLGYSDNPFPFDVNRHSQARENAKKWLVRPSTDTRGPYKPLFLQR